MRPIRWVLAATAALALASSATARQASATEGNARRALLAQDEGDGAEGVDGGEAVETGGGGNEAFDSTISGPGTVPGEPQVLLANGISMARRASATDGNAGRALLAQDEGDGAEGVDGGEAVETGGGGDEAFDSTISGPGTAPAESQVLLADAISMALDTVPAGLESCDRGEGSLKVAFALSNCFTFNEMKAIIQQVNTAIATAASNKFYFNDAFIERKFAWGYYLDGLCSNLPVLTTIGEVKPWPKVGLKYDLFVNVAKNKGGSFLPLLPITTLRVGRTLATRICAGTSCPTPNTAITVPTIATYGSVASSVTNAMYCGGVTGSSPATYTSDQNKKQCGCGCPGDKVPSNGCCECPGELEAIAGGDTCGCTNGRTKTADNKCICTGGRTYTAGECRCQTGYSYDGTVCVRDCFWLAGNAGSVCPWGDPLKTFLTLSTDCQIVAPVPQDNYVGDKRTNKFDPTSPAAYGSPSNDPKITISAAKTGIATDTKSTSWLNYALSPGTLEDNVHLTTFGVFDLSLVASDYRGHAQCVGCVAVQDTFPPTPTNPCGLDTTTTVVHNDYSVAKLGEYVAAEDTFTNFYANVQNNGAENAAGDNKRADVESTTLVDFFNTAVPSATLATRCFTDNYVSELLNSASTMTLDAVSAVARSADKSSLVCERCCTKHKVLKEEWYPYTCATPNPPKQVQGTAECNLNRCLKTQPTTLLSATFGIAGDAAGKTTTTINGLPAGTVGTTGTNYIHRSVTCKTWAEACTVGVTLENLFTKTADWKPTAAVPPTYDAANFVTYIYKVGAGGSWAAWNDATELTFSGEETEVYVQAWSRCGLIQENMFVFKIHLHSSRDVCKDFQQRWVDNSPTPRTAPNDISATCAYPGSDFALLTFNYDSSENVPHEAGKVKGKYTNLVCTLVAEDAAPTVVTTGVDMTPSFGLADPKPTPFTIAKQFAVELMKEPTTSKNTHVSISCVFTFQYFDTSTTTTDTCSASFVFTDCDLPTVDTASESVQCLPRDCGGPNALPGAFETCNGDVFTTAVVGGVSTTQTKPLTDACCAACSSALQCAAVSGTSSVKRCVPTPALMLAALAMDETDRAARTVMEAETEAQPLSSSTMALLMGATAMVAVVALVVAKTRAKKKQQTVADDAYVSLLD